LTSEIMVRIVLIGSDGVRTNRVTKHPDRSEREQTSTGRSPDLTRRPRSGSSAGVSDGNHDGNDGSR
jgi:hypothetical protein